MMEQYLDGPEVDVDVVLNSEGDVVYGNVTDNWPTIEPYFNETGGTSEYPFCGVRPVRSKATLSKDALVMHLQSIAVSCAALPQRPVHCTESTCQTSMTRLSAVVTVTMRL